MSTLARSNSIFSQIDNCAARNIWIMLCAAVTLFSVNAHAQHPNNLALSGGHTCVLTNTSALLCWGTNLYDWNANTYAGPFYATTGSPWLGATYNASALAVQPVGTMSLNFTSATAGTMTYTFTAGPFAGTSQTKPIERQNF